MQEKLKEPRYATKISGLIRKTESAAKARAQQLAMKKERDWNKKQVLKINQLNREAQKKLQRAKVARAVSLKKITGVNQYKNLTPMIMETIREYRPSIEGPTSATITGLSTETVIPGESLWIRGRNFGSGRGEVDLFSFSGEVCVSNLSPYPLPRVITSVEIQGRFEEIGHVCDHARGVTVFLEDFGDGYILFVQSMPARLESQADSLAGSCLP